MYNNLVLKILISDVKVHANKQTSVNFDFPKKITC